MEQTENTLIETLTDILGDDFITKISTATFDTNREKVNNAVGKEKIQLLFKDGSEITLTINKKKLNISSPELDKIEIQRKYPEETNLIIFKLLEKTRERNSNNLPDMSLINISHFRKILVGTNLSIERIRQIVKHAKNMYIWHIQRNKKYALEDCEVQDTELLERCYKECLRINK